MMSKLKKLSLVFIGVLVLPLLCTAGCATTAGISPSTFASTPPYAPLPHYLAFKWDISNKDVPLEKEFSVERYDIYLIDFCLRESHPIPSSDRQGFIDQAHSFFGNGSPGIYDLGAHKYLQAITSDEMNQGRELIREGKAVWKYNQPGVIIPVHLQIENLQDGKLIDVAKDQTFDVEGQMINSEGISGWGYGCLFRAIGGAKMRPGNYKITAGTNKQIILPPNTEIYLYLSKVPNTRPLKDNE